MSPEKQTRCAPAARLERADGSSWTSRRTPEPEVVDEREVVPAGETREVGERRLLREADDAEVGLVHAQEHRGRVRQRALVVGDPGPVRRADLDEAGARAGEHVGDPEPVSDLHELPARDDDVTPLGEGRQREQHGGGVVVDDESGVGAGQLAQVLRDVILPRAPCPGGDVVLEVRVAARDLGDALERRPGEGRPAEVRVHDDTGRVQHAAQAGRDGMLGLLRDARREIAGLEAGQDLLTGPCERPSRRRHERLAAVPLGEGANLLLGEKPID